jgi:hypothetical protein
MPARSPRHLALLAAALTTLAIATPARGNGRFPQANQIALSPADPSTILVRATYGLLLTRDGGQRWSWICEPAVGFDGPEDPMVAFTKDGTLLAGLFEGLSVSHDAGCQWDFAPGGLSAGFVVDLSVDEGDPSSGVVLASLGAGVDDAGAPVYRTQLWQTSDNGVTWSASGSALPPELVALTVDTAPSDPSRVYVSGHLAPPAYGGVIERSDDRGATWQEQVIPGADGSHLPYIGAVDPTSPDVLYVRLDGDPVDQLLVSKDGGATWQKVFETTGNMSGFALSPDGATVALGGASDGLWTAPAATLQFTKSSAAEVACLTWSLGGLYACADETADMFTVGLSTDQGKTWRPLMHLPDLCGPLECDASTSVGQQCPSLWPSTQSILDATCDGSDAGTSGTTSSSTTSASSSGSSSSSGGAGGGGAGGHDGGARSSGCSLLGAAGDGAAAALAALAALGMVGRGARRRERRSISVSRGPVVKIGR